MCIRDRRGAAEIQPIRHVRRRLPEGLPDRNSAREKGAGDCKFAGGRDDILRGGQILPACKKEITLFLTTPLKAGILNIEKGAAG